jgi:hypothetical protein
MPIQQATLNAWGSAIQQQYDVITTNVWTMDILMDTTNSVTTSGKANFTTLSGLERSMEVVEQADGGSGLVRKFPGNRINYGEITITRVRNGSQDDQDLVNMVTQFFNSGNKYNGIFTKYHHGNVIRMIHFYGLCATKEGLPTYDLNSNNKEEITYTFAVDYWYEEFPSGDAVKGPATPSTGA